MLFVLCYYFYAISGVCDIIVMWHVILSYRRQTLEWAPAWSRQIAWLGKKRKLTRDLHCTIIPLDVQISQPEEKKPAYHIHQF